MHKAPTGFGRISKATLIVMREAGQPLTISEIAERLLSKEGVGEVDPETQRSVRNAVDRTLRQKATKRIVEHDGSKSSRKWSLVTRH